MLSCGHPWTTGTGISAQRIAAPRSETLSNHFSIDVRARIGHALSRVLLGDGCSSHDLGELGMREAVVRKVRVSVTSGLVDHLYSIL